MRCSIAWLILFMSGIFAVCRADAGEPADPGPAPLRLSLDECIERALANSRKLMAERKRLEMLDAQVQQAYWAPFSEISARLFATVVPDKCVEETRYGTVVPCGSDTNGDGVMDEASSTASVTDDVRSFSTDQWGPMLKFDAKLGVPIYTFGKIANSWKAVEAARAAKEAEFPRFKNKIRYQVAMAYQAVSGAREMLYTIGKGREYLAKALNKVRSDLEKQEGGSTEVDRIRLEVLENEVAEYEAQAREVERVGLASLRLLVLGKDRERVEILDAPQERLNEDIGPLETYRDKAIDHRPELRALRYARRALEAKVKLRKAEFWPDLLGSVGFSYAWTPGRTDIDYWVFKDNYNFGPAVAFGISLDYKLDVGLDIYKLQEAKAELAALTIDQEEALDAVLLEVDKVYHRVVSVRDSLDAMQKSRRLVKGWIAAELQNQATGLSSAKQVKDALSEYFKVMASVHMLTNEYNVGMAELSAVTGSPEKE